MKKSKKKLYGNGGAINNFIDPITTQGLSTPRIAFGSGGEVGSDGTLYVTDLNDKRLKEYKTKKALWDWDQKYKDYHGGTRITPKQAENIKKDIEYIKKKYGAVSTLEHHLEIEKESGPEDEDRYKKKGTGIYLPRFNEPTKKIKYAPPEIVEKQKKLREAGLYEGTLDGIWGKNSKTAWEEYTRKEEPKEGTKKRKVIYTDDINDPRLKKYNNKIDVYNKYQELLKNLTPMTQEWADDNSAVPFENSFVLPGDTKDDEKNKKAFEEFKRKEKELNDYAKSVGVDISPDMYTSKNKVDLYNRNQTEGEGILPVSMYDQPDTDVFYRKKEEEEEKEEKNEQIIEPVEPEPIVAPTPQYIPNSIKRVVGAPGPTEYFYMDFQGRPKGIKDYMVDTDLYKDLEYNEVPYKKAYGGPIKDTDMQNMDFNTYVALMNAQRQQMDAGGTIISKSGALLNGTLKGASNAFLPPGVSGAVNSGLDSLHNALDKDISEEERSYMGYGQAAAGITSAVVTGGATLPNSVGSIASGLGEGIAHGSSLSDEGKVRLKMGADAIGTIAGLGANMKKPTGTEGMNASMSEGLGAGFGETPDVVKKMSTNLGNVGQNITQAPEQSVMGTASNMGTAFNTGNPLEFQYGGPVQMAQGGFKPHPMYKDGQMIMANDYETHLSLKEQGYGHEQMDKGGMILRADGSRSKRGLYDNIRANAGSGKNPTKEMLAQERKIKRMDTGGFMSIENGGTHEQNPMGGVPIGPKASVEEGETVMDLIEGGKFVFTDRDGPKGKKGKTFADISKKIRNKYKDREGDAAAERAMNQELYSVANNQEERKEAKMLKLQAEMDELNPQGASEMVQQPQQGMPLGMKMGGPYYGGGGMLYNMGGMVPGQVPMTDPNMMQQPMHQMPDGTMMPGANHEEAMQMGAYNYGGTVNPVMYPHGGPVGTPHYTFPGSLAASQLVQQLVGGTPTATTSSNFSVASTPPFVPASTPANTGITAAKGYNLPGASQARIKQVIDHAYKTDPKMFSKYGLDDRFGEEYSAAYNKYKDFDSYKSGADVDAILAQGKVNTTNANAAHKANFNSTLAQGAADDAARKQALLDAEEKEQKELDTKRRNAQIYFGAFANSAPDLYNLYQGIQGPDDINLARLSTEDVNLQEQRNIAKVNAANSQAIQRENVRNTAQSSGAALAGLSAGTAAIDQNLGNVLRESAVTEETMNTQMANQTNQYNVGVSNKEQELNLMAEAKAQEAIVSGLAGIGRNTAGALKDVRMSNQVDKLNDTQLSAIESILSNYTYDKNGKIIFKTA